MFVKGYLEYDLEQDIREWFRACSYCTYYQRPNLTAGEFQEIISDEGKKAFKIFSKMLEVIKPRLLIVLSAKASESIKKHLAGRQPYKILYFNSAIP